MWLASGVLCKVGPPPARACVCCYVFVCFVYGLPCVVWLVCVFVVVCLCLFDCLLFFENVLGCCVREP